MGGVIVRPEDTFWSLLRRGLWEGAKEIGPMMLIILGLCTMGIGAINHSEGVSDLAYDSHLRAVGVGTTGKVVEVDHYHSTGYRGRGADHYTPITLQKVDGKEYRTRLSVYEVANDRNFYRVGQRLPILYDPADPEVASYKSNEFRSRFESNIAAGGHFLYAGRIAFLIGLPLGAAQYFLYLRKRWITREERGWRKLRYGLKRRRRKLREQQRRSGSKQARPWGRHSL